jgi:preprotein translocase subunit SecF
MGIHRLVIVISIISIIASFILIFTRGLNLGIDFSGGILIEARLSEKTDLSKLHEILNKDEFGEITIQNFDENDIIIRASNNKDENQGVVIKKIQAALSKSFSDVEYRKIDFVGPQVGGELIKSGLLALITSCLFIMIYIWIRFDWQFGLGAIAALFHDAMLTFGFFALTGLEFNLTSIAAILTIIGYSINDSVVIYDRIRENLRKFKKSDLSDLLNSSINSTLSRTVLTSGVTLVSIVALIIFGGEALRSFSIATFFGIIVGTYSSIYISAPILIYMDPRKKKEREKE